MAPPPGPPKTALGEPYDRPPPTGRWVPATLRHRPGTVAYPGPANATGTHSSRGGAYPPGRADASDAFSTAAPGRAGSG
jgi:hypothetical protein